MSRNAIPKLLPDDESASVPLLTSSHRSYDGVSDSKHDGKHEHSITVIESDAKSTAPIPLSDAKEEKRSAQQEKPTIASLSLYRDNLQKGVDIIIAAIARHEIALSTANDRATSRGRLVGLGILLALVSTIAGLSYGCSQECDDDKNNGSSIGYVVSLPVISIITALYALIGFLSSWRVCSDCFSVRDNGYSFSPEEQAQLQPHFINPLNVPIPIEGLKGRLNYLTQQLATIEHDLGQAIQRYQSRLTFLLGDCKQEPKCRLHYAFFKHKLAHVAPISTLIFEAAGIAVAPQNGQALKTDQTGNSPDTKADSRTLTLAADSTTEHDSEDNDSEHSAISTP